MGPSTAASGTGEECSALPYQRIRASLTQSDVGNTLDSAANQQLPYRDMLALLPGAEVAARWECFLGTRPKLAPLFFRRTLEQFDFGFQPSIDERLVKDLAD